MKVEVTRIKIIENAEPLRAFADVQIDEKIEVRGLRLIQETGCRAYLQMPAVAWNSPNGRKFRTVINLANAIKQQVTSAVLVAYEEQRQEKEEVTRNESTNY